MQRLENPMETVARVGSSSSTSTLRIISKFADWKRTKANVPMTRPTAKITMSINHYATDASKANELLKTIRKLEDRLLAKAIGTEDIMMQ
jgi:hypothetical protein